MEPHVAEHFCYRETSKIIWEDVKKRFGKQNNYAHIFQIKKELAQNKQNQRPFAQLYSEMQKKWDELDILQPDVTDPNQIQERKEQERVFQLLANLDPSYEAFRSQILLNPTLPSIDNVAALIEQEESRRNVMGVPPAKISEGSETHALAVKQFRNPSFKGKGAAKDEKCSHCKKPGHKAEVCWFLHPHLRPAGWVDKGEGGKKIERSGGSAWERKKGGENEGMGRGFSTQTLMCLVGEAMDASIGNASSGSDGSGTNDPMQYMFKQFSMWYSKQNCDGPGDRGNDW